MTTGEIVLLIYICVASVGYLIGVSFMMADAKHLMIDGRDAALASAATLFLPPLWPLLLIGLAVWAAREA